MTSLGVLVPRLGPELGSAASRAAMIAAAGVTAGHRRDRDATTTRGAVDLADLDAAVDSLATAAGAGELARRVGRGPADDRLLGPADHGVRRSAVGRSRPSETTPTAIVSMTNDARIAAGQIDRSLSWPLERSDPRAHGPLLLALPFGCVERTADARAEVGALAHLARVTSLTPDWRARLRPTGGSGGRRSADGRTRCGRSRRCSPTSSGRPAWANGSGPTRSRRSSASASRG